MKNRRWCSIGRAAFSAWALLWLAAGAALGDSATSAPGSGPRERAAALYVVLVASLGMVFAFAVAALLVLRAGRALRARQTGFQKTTYVDAWGQARVTDAQLRAIDDSPPPDAPDAGDDPNAPPPKPPESA